jgi:transposase-like protein
MVRNEPNTKYSLVASKRDKLKSRVVVICLSVPKLCREVGVSSATFYKWRDKYGDMDTSMMARLKKLEVENARLSLVHGLYA